MEHSGVIVAVLWIMVGVPIIALVLLKDRIQYRRALRDHPETVPGTPEYLARVDQPQFEQLETRLGCRLPESYRSLYCNKALTHDFRFALVPPGTENAREFCEIREILPADQEALRIWGKYLGSKNLPFATDHVGDVYYLPLDAATEVDAPVWKFLGEEGQVKVAESLAQFLTWRRVRTSNERH